MRIPETPPTFQNMMRDALESHGAEKTVALLASGGSITDDKGRYLHWEKLKHLSPPKDLTPQEYWLKIKMARNLVRIPLPLYALNDQPFGFCISESMQRDLHWLDKNTAGTISMEQPITNPNTRNTYLITSLVEESISSSQLEGASTTRNDAKEMLRANRAPADHSEQMIFNNYQAMQLVRDFKDDDLTPSLIMQLHQVITENTLDGPKKAGCLRTDDDNIHVVDFSHSTILYTPPSAEALPNRLQILCDFANDTQSKVFIHPVIRAIMLHFMIGYDHPFVDGNGRTARAIFYWAMVRSGYWLTEYISISNIIKQAPIQYGKAYLHTETDGDDATYFLIHQLEVLKQAVSSLHSYLSRKALEIEETEKLLDNTRVQGQLNHRQLSLLKHAIKNPNALYSIQEHQQSHGISYQTARTDLLTLADKFNLLRKRKYGNSFVFVALTNIRDLL